MDVGMWLTAAVLGLQIIALVAQVTSSKGVTLKAFSTTSEEQYYYSVAGRAVPLGAILRESVIFVVGNEVETIKEVTVSVGYKDYDETAINGDNGNFKELASTVGTRNIIAIPALMSNYDITEMVNPIKVTLDPPGCNQQYTGEVSVQLQVRVMDATGVSVYAESMTFPVAWKCQEPHVALRVNCLVTGVNQPFEGEFQTTCGKYRTVNVTTDGWPMPETHWRTSDGVLIDVLKLNTGHPQPITNYFDTKIITIPRGQCDNRDVHIQFNITDDIVNVTGILTLTALCSFDGKDHVMITGITQRSDPLQPWRIVDGNIATALQDLDFVVEGIAGLPRLTYKDVEEKEQEAEFFLALFLTKRDINTISQAHCERGQKDVANIMAEDLVLGKPQPFKSNSDMPELKYQLLKSLHGETLDSICGLWTLVVAVDPIKTITHEENPCNNFLALSLDFGECDTSAAPTTKIYVTHNPFAGGHEFGVSYWGHQDSKFYLVRPGGWSTTFTQVQPHSPEDSKLARQGYGRLKLVQKHLGTGQDNCLYDEAKELLHEMEDIEEGEDPMEPEVPGFPMFESLLADMKGQSGSGSGLDIMGANKTAMALQNLDAVGKAVLNASFHALKARADKMMQEDLCSSVYYVEGMTHSHAAYDYTLTNKLSEDHTLKALVNIFVNISLTALDNMQPLVACSKTMLAKYAMSLRGDKSTGMTGNKWVQDKESQDRGWQNNMNHCAKPNRCIRKLKQICMSSGSSSEETPVAEDKPTICLAHKMMKYFHERGHILGFRDLVEADEAERDDDDEDSCPREHGMKVEMEPVVPVKVVDEMVLKVGSLSLHNDKARWRTVAQSQCPACSTNMAQKRK